jgi:Domain of unknown function (DUF5122) beta-propeller
MPYCSAGARAPFEPHRSEARQAGTSTSSQATHGRQAVREPSPSGLARVNPDGTLDARFGTGGVLTTTINGNEAVQAILIQPDGKILAVGNSAINATGRSFIVIARYLP